MSQGLTVLSRFGLKPRGIIHVGANKGQEVPDYRESGIRPVVLIEPLPQPFTALVKAVGDEEGFFAIQACCSDADGRVVNFHVASNGGQSSSYLTPTGHREVAPHVQFSDPLTLTTTTLASLLASAQGLAVEQLDYLAIDAQGAERDILVGAGKALDRVNFVWMEVTFGGLYEGDIDVYTMIEFMRARGFDLYLLKMNARHWGDALFIRQGTVRIPVQ